MTADAAAGPAADRTARARRALRHSAGLVDQVVSGLSNVLAVVLVARASSPDDFGRFSLGYATLTLALTVTRSSLGTRISLSRGTRVARDLTQQLLAAVLLLSPVVVLLVLATGVGVTGTAGLDVLLVVALALVTVSVVLGLLMAGKVMRKPGRARTMVAIHEQTALAGLIAIGVHGLTLLGDAFLHPGLTRIAIPGVMDYRPLWTGLGIGAGYLAAALGLSFYVRRWIGVAVWRWLHRWTLAVYVLAIGHTLGAGTDAGAPWMRVLLLAALAAPLYAAVYRFLPGGSRGTKSGGQGGKPRRVAKRRSGILST